MHFSHHPMRHGRHFLKATWADLTPIPYESAFGTLMHPMVTMSANIAHVVNIIIIIHYVVVLSIFSSILEIQQNLASHLVGSKKDA